MCKVTAQFRLGTNLKTYATSKEMYGILFMFFVWDWVSSYALNQKDASVELHETMGYTHTVRAQTTR